MRKRHPLAWLHGRGAATAAAVALSVIGLAPSQPALAQPPGALGGGPQPSARDAAPVDLTGQWVSIVTEDWRFRMLTAPKGDAAGVPLTAEGREVAEAWDPEADEAADEACKAYGAAGVMRLPGRIRISWEDDSTLRIETDAGTQTRLFHFDEERQDGGEPTWQGVSQAEWVPHSAGFGQPPENGSLKVVTTGMKAGYLRRNGIPYSGDAVVTEYYDLLRQPDGSQWLVVKTIVEDPLYLRNAFITSSNFRKEEGRGGWNPRPCSAD